MVDFFEATHSEENSYQMQNKLCKCENFIIGVHYS